MTVLASPWWAAASNFVVFPSVSSNSAIGIIGQCCRYYWMGMEGENIYQCIPIYNIADFLIYYVRKKGNLGGTACTLKGICCCR